MAAFEKFSPKFTETWKLSGDGDWRAMLSFLKTKLSPNSEVKETPIFFEKAEEVTETLEWKELTFDIIRNIRDPGC